MSTKEREYCVNCKHKDCTQDKTPTHQSWEKLTEDYRRICREQLRHLNLKVLKGECSLEELMGMGNLLLLAFDLEQSSKVFDDTIKHTKVNMARVKHVHEREKDEHKGRTSMGFVFEHEDVDNFEDDELE